MAQDELGRPSAARTYDWLLKGPEACGGGESYALPQDRALVRRLLEIDPAAGDRARANRRFLAAAAADAARAGITQGLDLGAGLPAEPSTDRAMREILPAARVTYVDSDPFAACAWDAARPNDDGITALCADLADPGTVLAMARLDLSRPVAVILGSVLQLVKDPGRIVAEYARAIAPGSRMIVSVISYASADLLKRTEEAAGMPVASHDRDDLAALLDGLDILPPGITTARAAAHGIRWIPRRPGALMLTVVAVVRPLRDRREDGERRDGLGRQGDRHGRHRGGQGRHRGGRGDARGDGRRH